MSCSVAGVCRIVYSNGLAVEDNIKRINETGTAF